MPKADANLNIPPTSGTLSALAASLGEIEPPERDGALTPAHVSRIDILIAAAPLLRVRTAADAALALSLAAEIQGYVVDFELSEEEREEKLARATVILAQTARWLMEAHGARPLHHSWPMDATPFPEAPA